MDWLLIILEYSVFTVPVIVSLVVSFRWFLRSRSYERILYIVSFFLPIASVASLLKVFYIIELSPTPTAFVFVNSAFALGLLVFVSFVIIQTSGKALAKPKKSEVIGVLLLVASSLLLKNVVEIIDLISWGVIGLTTAHLARGFAYSKYGRKREKHAYTVAVLFSSLSTLLKFLLYLDIIPLKPTIYISLTLMLLALLHAVFTWWKVSLLTPQINLTEEVFKEKASIFRRLIFLSLLATIIISGVAYFGFREYRTEKLRLINELEFNVEKVLYSIRNNFENYLTKEVEEHLLYLASTIDTDNIDKAKFVLEKFYDTHKETIASVTLMDNKGIILYTYPYTYITGTDISSQAHVKEVLEKKQTVLSEPFRAVQGFYAIAIHMPLFKDNEFFGTIASLIDLKTLSKKLYISEPFNFVVGEEGIVIASNISNDIILKNIGTIIESISNKNAIIKSYSFTYRQRFFEIYVAGDMSTIQGELNRIFRNIMTNFGLFTLFFMLFFFLTLIGIYETEKETTKEIEDSLRKELEALQEYKTVQEKLNLLNDFIYETSLETPIEEVVTRFLEIIITLIPKVEKGVLWSVLEDKVIPSASIGYDTEVLKKLAIEKSHEEKLWHSPTVIQHIGISGFPEELREFAKELNLEEIKETLIIPIKVEGHYMGHLSLDIFKDGVHFDENDIKLANTVSKIISFYLQIQGAFNALKKEVNLNATLASNLEAIITFISKTTFKESEEEFFNDLLNLAFSMVESGELGSVLLRIGNNLRFVAAVGYDIEKLNKVCLDLEFQKKLVGPHEVAVIENIGFAGVKEEQLELAKEAQMDVSKYCLTASFFIDKEYYGGIFIDSTKDENPFGEDDKEIMKALSNLGSLYIRTKKLLDDLAQELAVDDVISKISKNLDPEVSTKEFATQVLNLIKKTFKEAEYIKASIELEDSLVHLLVYNDSAKFSKTSFEIPEYKFEEEELFKRYFKTKYAINKDAIEIGLQECETNRPDVIYQLELAILPALKSFFVYKDRAKLFADMMIAFARAIDSKDPYTRLHSENVTKYAYFFGKHLNLDDNSLKKLVLSSILHDVGKIGVSETILAKPGKLTEYERAIIQIHPTLSFEIVSAVEGLRDVSIITKFHHERWDGKGYPEGLKGEEIPYLSRIITIVDAFDAMTTDRPYRKALSVEEAIEEIKRNAGTQFDPELAAKFIELKDTIIFARSIHVEEVIHRALKIE